ncbi:MAG: hypothetical protein H8D23_10100 [Candidatus Brocadiales bacterium]|nr:hypothetical protein [Candidatus Brocadiales bacterium]
MEFKKLKKIGLFELLSKRRKDLVIFLDDAYEGLVYDQDVRQWSPFSDFSTVHSKILPVQIDDVIKEFFFEENRLYNLSVSESFGET